MYLTDMKVINSSTSFDLRLNKVFFSINGKSMAFKNAKNLIN